MTDYDDEARAVFGDPVDDSAAVDERRDEIRREMRELEQIRDPLDLEARIVELEARRIRTERVLAELVDGVSALARAVEQLGRDVERDGDRIGAGERAIVDLAGRVSDLEARR